MSAAPRMPAAQFNAELDAARDRKLLNRFRPGQDVIYIDANGNAIRGVVMYTMQDGSTIRVTLKRLDGSTASPDVSRVGGVEWLDECEPDDDAPDTLTDDA